MDGPALVPENVDEPVDEDAEERVDEELPNDDAEFDTVLLLVAEPDSGFSESLSTSSASLAASPSLLTWYDKGSILGS